MRSAVDGEQAIELAELERPDVILMDLRMPRLDGLQATRRLTQMGLPSRVLILTARRPGSVVEATTEAGAIGCLVGCAAEALVAAVRGSMGGTSAG